jgi:hypothetical protein
MRMSTRGTCVLALLSACGGGSGRAEGDGSQSGDPTGSSITLEGSGTGATDDATGSASDDQGTMTSAPTTTAADSSSTTPSDESDDAPQFDVGVLPDTQSGGCECGSQLGFSYIWIANTDDGSVAKINTQTVVEEARYRTMAAQPVGETGPSRTSVNLGGNAVAIANRGGGLTKILAVDCNPGNNGDAGLQTSTGAADVLPFLEDDCVEWHTPFPYDTQRPVAWAPGVLDQRMCTYSEEKVWTAGCNVGAGDQWVTVNYVDGDTGVVEEAIQVVGFACSSLSPYGGAVNSAGDFWFTSLTPGADQLGFVDRATFDYEVIVPPITPYGMTVDHAGRVWLAQWVGAQNASAARYTPDTQTWDLANNHVAYVMSGIQEDGEGRMWMNYWTYDGGMSGGLTYIDVETMEVGPAFEIAASERRGISVDLDGNIWSTARYANSAYRFNPDTLQIDTYDGLIGPYTYSDMTGWGLQSVSCGPEG